MNGEKCWVACGICSCWKLFKTCRVRKIHENVKMSRDSHFLYVHNVFFTLMTCDIAMTRHLSLESSAPQNHIQCKTMWACVNDIVWEWFISVTCFHDCVIVVKWYSWHYYLRCLHVFVIVGHRKTCVQHILVSADFLFFLLRCHF